MLSVDEALRLVLDRAAPKPPQRVPLSEAAGLRLAEDITSDVDSPPHDKSMMDGYAVMAADLAEAGSCELTVLEEVTAGATPSLPVASGQATRIMTGAPIPKGAEAVVMIERTEMIAISPGGPGQPVGVVRIRDPNFRPGQNIMRRGESLRRGQTVLQTGRGLRAVEIGLLAEVGQAEILTTGQVSASVLATGNELVPVEQTPAAGQIRNSNGPLLIAAIQKAGATPIDLGIARDEPQALRERIEQGLEADVLILSGGVSAGVLDLVPTVLAELGVKQVFHKVRLKPGKPLWFGVAEKAGRRTLVFGLPGNPVSSLVCFELFVRAAIDSLAGRGAAVHRVMQVPLAADFTHRGDRPTYFPGLLQNRFAAGDQVTPVKWKGSADLCGFAQANCLIAFEAGDRTYTAGETVRVFLMDRPMRH